MSIAVQLAEAAAGDLHQLILKTLARDGIWTTKNLSIRLKVPQSRVAGALKKLMADGKIDRLTGEPESRHWGGRKRSTTTSWEYYVTEDEL